MIGSETHTRLQVTPACGGNRGPGADSDAPRCFDIDSRLLRGVLHRPFGAWVAEGAADRDYVVQERQALLLAWLNGMADRCINRPRADSLAGPAWGAAQWRWQAQRCGMPVAPWPDASGATPPLLRLLVTARRSFSVNGPPLDSAWHSAARTLAASCGCNLLGLYLAADGAGGWRFALASAQADPRAAGSAAADALADGMSMPAAQRAGLTPELCT